MTDFDWTETLKAVAPTLATAFLGPFAGVAVKVAGDALGLSKATQEDIKQAIQGGDPKVLAAMKQAEQSFKLEMKKLNIRETELYLGDVDSARRMQINVKSIMPGLLAIITVSGFFIILGGLATGMVSFKESQPLLILLGALARETASVYSYYFGSSRGSKDKDDTISKLTH